MLKNTHTNSIHCLRIHMYGVQLFKNMHTNFNTECLINKRISGEWNS